MSKEFDPEEEADRLEKAINVLSEHYDTVQIFCTRHEPSIADGTLSFTAGIGNFYARIGQVAFWMDEQSNRSMDQGQEAYEEGEE